MNWLRRLFGGGGKPAPPRTMKELVERAAVFADIRFVDDVLKVYRRTGSLSEKQKLALMRIVLEREAEERGEH